jgi:hypothetical protein
VKHVFARYQIKAPSPSNGLVFSCRASRRGRQKKPS